MKKTKKMCLENDLQIKKKMQKVIELQRETGKHKIVIGNFKTVLKN